MLHNCSNSYSRCRRKCGKVTQAWLQYLHEKVENFRPPISSIQRWEPLIHTIYIYSSTNLACEEEERVLFARSQAVRKRRRARLLDSRLFLCFLRNSLVKWSTRRLSKSSPTNLETTALDLTWYRMSIHGSGLDMKFFCSFAFSHDLEYRIWTQTNVKIMMTRSPIGFAFWSTMQATFYNFKHHSIFTWLLSNLQHLELDREVNWFSIQLIVISNLKTWNRIWISETNRHTPPKCVSPAVDLTSKIPSSITRTLTSKVPPPRSKIRTFLSAPTW